MYVALQLPIWSKSLYLEKKFTLYNFFTLHLYKFSDIEPPYTCVQACT